MKTELNPGKEQATPKPYPTEEEASTEFDYSESDSTEYVVKTPDYSACTAVEQADNR